MRCMRGLISWGAYLPYRRLDQSTIAAVAGQGGGKGTRTVASFDEDTTTMGVEAARLALAAVPACAPRHRCCSRTVAPAYADKTNATAIHAALRLDRRRARRSTSAASVAFGASAALRARRWPAGRRRWWSPPTSAPACPARPTRPTAATPAPPCWSATSADGPVVAELLGRRSATEEFLDRWRTPGDVRSKLWEEQVRRDHATSPLGQQAWKEALQGAGLDADADRPRRRRPRRTARVGQAVAAQARRRRQVVDDLAATVGITGAAQPGCCCSPRALEQRRSPGQVDRPRRCSPTAPTSLVFRTTDALAAVPPGPPGRRPGRRRRPRSPTASSSRGGACSRVEPPRRPEPARLVGLGRRPARGLEVRLRRHRDRATGTVHLPPSRVSMTASAPTTWSRCRMADATGTIVTFTVDRLAYSPSPPIVFAVVDFDGGGRLPIELTDVDADEVASASRVEMTFRRLFTADGIHNYFWKARPVRDAPPAKEA